jgi:NADPH-dependent 2,4-dienoyl-CoA reductase/sulfur reductase-like enzyme
MKHILIVGASLAGTTAAEQLRTDGFDGRITLFEVAAELPVDRPPLTKAVLAGEAEPTAAPLPIVGRLHDLDLELKLGTEATAFDAATRTVRWVDRGTGAAGESDADGVLLATGSRARRLPTAIGGDLDGVFTIRDGADAVALRTAVAATDGPARVVVIGSGFIGAEVAATLRSAGHGVTLVEAAPVPLQRVLPGDIGGFVATLHRGHGVDVRLGVGVDRITGTTRAESVVLSDGSEIPCDVVVAGVGAEPVTDWLDGSGLTLDSGVVCDETLLAAPGVVAAGDLCRWPHPTYGWLRVEQWENAIAQGGHAARRLLHHPATGPAAAFDTVPWFWSDQYGRKIQMTGIAAPDDEFVIDGDPRSGDDFLVLFGRDGRCTAALGVGRPRQVIRVRMRLAAGCSWDDARALIS